MTYLQITIESLKILFALTTFVAVVYGIRTTRHHFRLIRTLEYIARFNSEAVIQLRTEVERWLEGKTEEELLTDYESNHGIRYKVNSFMNLFQELGVAYKRNLIDRDVTFELFDFLVPNYWGKLSFLVDHYRNTSGDLTLYRKFSDLAEALSVRRENEKRVRDKVIEDAFLKER